MKTFRTLEQSKRDLQEIQEYVDLIEEYRPEKFVQVVIHAYVIHGSIAKTAQVLNNQGHNIEQEEVSTIIKNPPTKGDLLHKKVKSLYLKKTRSTRRVPKSYFY